MVIRSRRAALHNRDGALICVDLFNPAGQTLWRTAISRLINQDGLAFAVPIDLRWGAVTTNVTT
jgi:hypothetical protein